jgi:hypothetical protein
MKETAAGDSRAKEHVAREAVQHMLDATDAFIERRPDFPVKVGIYSFASRPRVVLRMQEYHRDRVRSAMARLPAAGGGTAIGDAMLAAQPDLYRSGVFRKYIIVVTDGENTDGRDPEDVAGEIHARSQGAVQHYFVAFDTGAEKFRFLSELKGGVLSAANGVELRRSLDEIYQGKILAEALDAGETDLPSASPSKEAGTSVPPQ